MTLWAISVRGPDDLIPVAGALTAHRLAHRFNTMWTNRVERDGLHENDPHMWATPVTYEAGPEWHAVEVERAKSGEYGWLYSDQIPEWPAPRSPSPNDDGLDT